MARARDLSRFARLGSLAGLWLVVLVPTLRGQSPEPLTEQRVRAITRQVASEAGSDSTALVLALDRQVRERWGEFESFPISLVRREDLLVTLTTPFMAYRRLVGDYLRMRRPLEEVPWTDEAVIAVNPERLGAPDIRSIVLTRDGRAVPPLDNRLRPMTFMNATGEKAVIHGGELRYPMSAFEPGAMVTVTAQPEGGEPFVYALTESQLRALK